MQLTIRTARVEDAALIAEYNAALARETENLELEPSRLLAGVRSVLEDRSKGFYLVAEVDGRSAGQLMLTFEWSDWRNGMFWWIQSVFVEPELRKKGVFRALYREAMERARKDPSVCGLRLYVVAENRRALSAYESMGMQRTPYQVCETDFVIHR